MHDHQKFAAAINCMDGRTQEPVAAWMKQAFQVDYVDMITEPGPVKILSEFKNTALVANIKRRLEVSVSKHLARAVAVVGHYDCAGNPVDKDTQWKQIAEAARVVEKWDLKLEVVGLYVDDKWQVNIVT